MIIIGLLVGAGGGYFYSNSVLQPKIDDLSKQVTSLGGQVASQTSMITQLNTTVNGLKGDKTALTSQVQDLQSKNTQQASDNAKLTSDLADSKGIVASQESTITDLRSKLSNLASTFNATPGYVGYHIYGFSFEAPQNMTLSFGGVLDATMNQNSGKITAQNNEQALAFFYTHTVTSVDLDAALNGVYTSLANSGASVNKAAIVTSAIEGHTMKYQTGSYTLSGQTAYVAYAYWYCPNTQRVYGFSYVATTQQSMMNGLNHLIATVRCHVDSQA
jgi:uncharacterized coiled-coil protein SlyX